MLDGPPQTASKVAYDNFYDSFSMLGGFILYLCQKQQFRSDERFGITWFKAFSNLSKRIPVMNSCFIFVFMPYIQLYIVISCCTSSFAPSVHGGPSDLTGTVCIHVGRRCKRQCTLPLPKVLQEGHHRACQRHL